VDAKKVTRLRRLRPGDGYVAWGSVAEVDGPSLNHVYPGNKLRDVGVLEEHGVPTISVCRDRDCLEPPRHIVRALDHHGGNDLLNPGSFHPAYTVHMEPIAREYRVHVWRGDEGYVSIRAGVKVPTGPDSHPWIRAHAAGWVLDYGGECQATFRDKHRSVAKAACEALNLDFGAVDVAEREDGSVLVLEVNRAPGLEGRTVEVYADRVASWWQTQQ